MPAAVELQQVSKEFSAGWLGRRQRAIDAVSFTLPNGAVCGLIGPNGSGKSTTLRLVAGLLVPTAGSCRLSGVPSDDPAARRTIGYLCEADVLPAHLTGREAVELAARLAGLARPRCAACVESAVNAVGLGSIADRRIATYSKGQRQRTGLAQAIVHDPALLLLDEPADGLDPEAAQHCLEIIRRQRAHGGTVLIASHQFDLLEAVCDHIALLERGRLRAFGPIDAVASGDAPAHRLTVEVRSSAALADVQAWLAARNGDVRAVSGSSGGRLAACYRALLGSGAEEKRPI